MSNKLSLLEVNKREFNKNIYKTNRFYISVKKIIWLLKNKLKIISFINKSQKSNFNNETIGQSAEYSLCKYANIVCNINSKRVNKNIVDIIYKKLQDEDDNILEQLPSTIYESCGYKNGSIDFKLENNETLSLKTLKYKDGKVCPQKVGQPTLKSWDKIWNKEWGGELNKNNDRWEFIKNNIHKYLNRMLEGIFCCDYLIIVKNCIYKPEILFYNKELLKKNINYFTNQEIIYSRNKYEERWNEKKQKYSEMSSTIKINISGKIIKIGEFQFHKSSRKELKFRFWDEFLQKLF